MDATDDVTQDLLDFLADGRLPGRSSDSTGRPVVASEILIGWKQIAAGMCIEQCKLLLSGLLPTPSATRRWDEWPPRIIAVTSEIRTGQPQELFSRCPKEKEYPEWLLPPKQPPTEHVELERSDAGASVMTSGGDGSEEG